MRPAPLIEVRRVLDKDQTKALIAEEATDNDYDVVVDTDADVRDADTGQLLLCFRKGIIAPRHVELARQAWVDIDERERPSTTRASAAGKIDLEKIRQVYPNAVGFREVGANRGHVIVEGGRELKAMVSNPVFSFLAGFGVNRYTSMAVKNRLTKHYPERWASSIPFFQDVNGFHALAVPDVHALHVERVKRHPRWVIPGTVLSTSTVNYNYESAYHYDVGDFKQGFSSITVIEKGEYEGGLLVFPHYRIALDVRTGDVAVKQSHLQLHGNTRLVKKTPDGKRVSFITYLKHKLADTENRMADPNEHDEGWRDGKQIFSSNKSVLKKVQVLKAKKSGARGERR